MLSENFRESTHGQIKNKLRLVTVSAFSDGACAHYVMVSTFNGSHFGLPPSEIHRRTGLPPKIVWTMTYSRQAPLLCSKLAIARAMHGRSSLPSCMNFISCFFVPFQFELTCFFFLFRTFSRTSQIRNFGIPPDTWRSLVACQWKHFAPEYLPLFPLGSFSLY